MMKPISCAGWVVGIAAATMGIVATVMAQQDDGIRDLVAGYVNEAVELANRFKANRDKKVEIPASHVKSRSNICALGDKALPALKEAFLALSVEDRCALLLTGATSPQGGWCVLTPAAGEFLAGQVDLLPADDQRNALMLAAMCGYKPVASRIVALYEDRPSNTHFDSRNWFGAALCYVGDYRHVPVWTREWVLPKSEEYRGSVALSFVPPFLLNRAVGPAQIYYERCKGGARAVRAKEPGESDGLAGQMARCMKAAGCALEGEELVQGWTNWAESPEGKVARVNSLLWIGYTCMGQGDYEVSEVCLKEALRLDVKNPQASAARALALARSGRRMEAGQQLAIAVGLGEHSPLQVFDMALTYREINEKRNARETLRRLLGRWPKDARALWFLAMWEMEDGNPQEAKRLAEELRVVDPKRHEMLVIQFPALRNVNSGIGIPGKPHTHPAGL